MLHVGDPDSTSKRQKIQPVLDLLCPTFEQAYTPAREIAIDESMISFRCRVSFRQYLKGKPNPWGTKAFVLSDGSGYLYRAVVYYGRETLLIDRPDLGHTPKLVLTLAEPLTHKGYDLYTDRYYTSPILADELEKVGITLTGTVQINRKGLPQEMTAKGKQPKGTVEAWRSGSKMALSWVDKKKVFMLSTKHTNKTTQIQPRYKQL